MSDERGASAVEYALLIAGLAAVVVLAILVLGGPVQELFNDTCERVDEQETIAADCDE